MTVKSDDKKFDDKKVVAGTAPVKPANGIVGRFLSLQGRVIRGTLRELTRPARVFVSEAGEPLAGIVVEPLGEGGSGDAPFEILLPRFVYDCKVHSLRLTCEGVELENGTLHFAGDPTIFEPQAVRRAAEPLPAPAKTEVALAALVQGLQSQSEALIRVVRGTPLSGSSGQAPIDVGASRSLTLRYGHHYSEAMAVRGQGPDIVWFGIIDWAYRIQRPQHLATRFADLGSRVFYVSIVLKSADSDGRFAILAMPHPGVYEIRLKIGGDLPANIYGGFTAIQISEILTSLDELTMALRIRAPVAVVQFPAWHEIAFGMPGATVVYDCLDHIGGFSGIGRTIVDAEQNLINQADLVVTTATALEEIVQRIRPSVMVRNAADVTFFSDGVTEALSTRLPSTEDIQPRRVIGYFGAIAEWFEIEWVMTCARRHPDWKIELVGRVSGFDPAEAKEMPNIEFLGEKPYVELPAILANWDVAVIPFKLTDLILSTNPVKLYEYMAGGKPVVASPMPEVVTATELVYIAGNADEFETQIQRAIAEDGPERIEARRIWAGHHDWNSRAISFRGAVDSLTPKVSVVILAYNGWELTRGCIESVLQLSDYGNLEVILVDNASTDESKDRFPLLRLRDSRLKLIVNETNVGFAAGNNTGIRAATGDYIILLNNDTVVTKGWVRDLIRPMLRDPTIGMTGPLTNNIGNEQKVKITYENINQMHVKALSLIRRYSRRRLKVHNLAFFCVAISRAVLDKVGLLDEEYGLGFFEDDDYCRKVEASDFSMVIADDVFVHHQLSASFNELGAERKRAQMERNKAIYEAKWGAWKPHRYRDDPDFG